MQIRQADSGSGDHGVAEVLEILAPQSVPGPESMGELALALRRMECPAAKPLAEELEPTDEMAHDAYFRIGRVQGDDAAVFIGTIFKARAILLDEAAAGDAHTASLIDRALCDLAHCAAGCPLPPSGSWNQRPRGGAMRRWIRGHQIFAALTQGLIFSFHALGGAIRAGHLEETNRWAGVVVSLFQASGAALQFTGAFGVEEYNDSIRPSMMRPAAPVNLSGLMSADHRYLARQMRDLRPALKSMHQHHAARHEQLARALSDVYDCHIHVCERFVGARPSLLTAGTSEKSGPSLIEQFKTVRLKPFEHGQRAERLKESVAAPQGCPLRK